MQQLKLYLKLRDPVVISQSNATEGIHQGLDYIPGSNLQGAIAALAYRQLPKQQAEQWIHLGALGFGSALPAINSKQAMPIPLCFHYRKGKSQTQVDNFLHSTSNSQLQPKQHRQGYISSKQQWYKPEKDLHLRTAIHPETSTAQEAQLFAYQAIRQGSEFIACIKGEEQTLQQLQVLLPKTLRLGRSRSAHYGRAEITHASVEPLQMNWQQKNELTLWLASDLLVYDHNGQPTLQPTLQQLGLNLEGTLQKSYIRTRRYALYNAYRKSYDLQRQVLTQGSVLHYQLQTPLDDKAIAQLYTGLGSQTHSGLGQIVPMDSNWYPLLSREELTLSEYSAVNNDKQSHTKDSPLIHFLRNKLEQNQHKEALNQQVRQAIEKIKQHYQSVKNYTGESEVGPTKTQWNNLSSRIVQNRQNWQAILDEIVSNDDESWGQTDNQKSFADLFSTLYPPGREQQQQEFIILLAKKMAVEVEAIQKGENFQATRQLQ